MNCEHFLDSFSEYEDGLLTESERNLFDAHVRECESCGRYVAVVRRGRSLLTALPAIEPGEDFVPRLQHRLYHVADGERLLREGQSSSGITAVTALAIAVVLGVVAWSPSLRRSVEVELPAIVVNEPPSSRSLGLVYRSSPLAPAAGTSGDRSFWSGARDYLYETSPLQERYRRSLLRAGLE